MAESGTFCTAINCMDGRTQTPVNEFLAKYFAVDYVDAVTEPGPIKILAEQTDAHVMGSIMSRVGISVEKHGSAGVGIVAHYDCTGNPADKETQLRQLKAAVNLVRARYEGVRVVGLWVDENWQVELQSEGVGT